MGKVKIATYGINEVLKNVGGFWSAISGVSFLALNLYLYRYFFRKTVDKLVKEEMEKKKEESDTATLSKQHFDQDEELKRS